MRATADQELAELRRANAELQRANVEFRNERDVALAELQVRTAALAQRNSEYGERLEHQSATIDVLKAMSASPGDPQPVFDLIVERARDLCDAYGATVFEFDGTEIHWRAATGVSDDPAVRAAYEAQFPMVPTRGWAFGRAILDRRIIRIDDMEAEPGLDPTLRGITAKSNVTTPIMRGDEVIGAIGMGSRGKGSFSDSQIELLKTFAEQAAIAITSAETYRALQTRTSDLQETLEYQTATSDVLKAISSSDFELEPVFQAVVETATRLCRADQAVIYRYHDGFYRWAAGTSLLPDYEEIERGVRIAPGTGTLVGRVALERRPIEILDALADPLYEVKNDARIGGIRTLLGVPLMRDETPIGVIGLARQRIEAFTERQIELVKTFADQAVIAIENARLITEQRDALERQTATAEVLQVINSSPGNLAPVFDAVLDKAVRLCDSNFGILCTYDGGAFNSVAVRGTEPTLTEFLQAPLRPRPGGSLERIVRGDDVVQIADVTDDEAYRSGSPSRRAPADLGGGRTQLLVALRSDEKLMGTFVIFRQEVRPFSTEQIALLQSFAAQAVIAMENTRLLMEQHEALEQQTATAEVLKVINASPGVLAPVFDAVMEKATRLCEAAFGFLVTYHEEFFKVVSSRGLSEDLAEGIRLPWKTTPGTVFARMIEGQEFEHLADITLDEVYRSGSKMRRLLADKGDARTALWVALRKDDTLLGVLNVYRQEVRPFSDSQVALLRNFADQAVIAIENARLINETREALDQQTATSEVLQVINASPGDLAPVSEAILQKAKVLCEADMGTFWTFNGERFFPGVISQDHPLDRGGPTIRGGWQPGPHVSLGRVMAGEDTVHVIDVSVDPGYQSDATARARTAASGTRSALTVALRTEGRLLGAITTARKVVRPYSEKQIELLKSFAAQAVIAMENARLLNEQREALEQQTATAEVLQVINSSPGDLKPVFDAILRKAHTLCGAEYGVLLTYDGEFFWPAAAHGDRVANSESFRRGIRPGFGFKRLLGGERLLHVHDMAELAAQMPDDPLPRALAEISGIRTQLAVPLRRDDKLLGVITANRREVRPFAEKEIALLENFAAQAVIAMENARLLTEQREALERQTATAEVLAVINANPGNLTPVFDAILEKATRLCDAAFGLMAAYDSEIYRVVATHNAGSDLIEFLRAPPDPDPESALGRIERGEDLILFDDIADTDLYRNGNPRLRALVDLGGAHSYAAVALRKKDGRLLGIIAAYRGHVRPFEPNRIALLQSFGAQAVIAMENARLLTEQREALEQQTATAEVLQVINAAPGNLAPVFDAILEKAMQLCGVAFGILNTWDGKYAHVVAMRGCPLALSERLVARGPTSVISPAVARLFETKRPVHVPDVMTGEGYRNGHPDPRALVELGGARTFLAVPLRKDAAVLGYIAVYRQEVRLYSDKEVALLENFAEQAVIAMENARLINEIRQRQEELRVTFENMGDGVALFDETRHLAASNRRFQDMLDVPNDLISSQPAFVDYIRYLADQGEYGPDPEDHVASLLTLGSQPVAFERTRPNGRIIEVRSNPVPSGGFVVIYSDITERKQNEENLRAARDAAEEASRTIEAAYRDLKAAQASLIQAEKMASLGQLTAGIAHEIKNPLNFVNNFATLSVDLLDELKQTVAPGLAMLDEASRAEVDELSSTLASNLDKINEHGRRADGIVRSMLEHSRGSSGERRSIDLNSLVDEALNLAYHGARAQDQSFSITLQREFGESIAPITLAPQDVTRVLLNIISNGFYAARERQRTEARPSFEPTLKITTRELDHAVEIRVRDNGIGILPEIKDRLFQPFFTTKPTGEGTGLGLSMSYDIVTQQHGGNITVESEVGEYSEFKVRLPRNP